MIYTIGRSPENDIVIPFDDVSSKHALLTTTPNGYLIVEDLRTTNFTYINGRQISISRLFPGDLLWIASQERSYEWFTEEIIKLQPTPNKDYSDDFIRLRALYDGYYRDSYILEIKRQIHLTLVNIGIVLITMCIGYFFLKSNDPKEKIVQGFGSVILILGYLIFNVTNNRPNNKKEKLLVDFLLAYCCPACGHSFEPKNWKIISSNGCDRCKLPLQ